MLYRISLLLFAVTLPALAEQAPLLVPRGYKALANPQQGRSIIKPQIAAPPTPRVNRVSVQPLTGQAVQPALGTRKLASVSSNPYSKVRVSRRNALDSSPTTYRVGLMVGLANLSSGYASNQTDRGDYKTGQNITGGLNLDLRFSKWLGLEAEGIYAYAPTQTVLFSGTTETKMKLNHLGAMANPKVQFPFYLGSMRVIPKLGIGYGMFTINFKSESADAYYASEGSSSVRGPYGTLGFDLEPVQSLILAFDYAHTFAASTKYKDSLLSVDDSSGSGKYQRIRAGLLYRFSEKFYGGGSFIKRTLSNDLDYPGILGGPSSNESISQFTGNVAFEF